MAIIIDGYNLLHVTGLFGPSKSGGSFEASRTALLNFLAKALQGADRESTTVVFDAAEAPRGLPHAYAFRGLSVRFSRGYPDADALIEKLIKEDTSPRRLVVVSSDRRLQRAARRRRAKAIDSDRWYAQLWRELHRRHHPPDETAPLPKDSFTDAEIQTWIAEFESELASDPEYEEFQGHWPFPPGYGEDAIDEEESS